MHQHKCSLCGTTWQHGEEWDKDTRAHECRTCGSHQFRVFKNAGPGTPVDEIPSPAAVTDALGNTDPFVRSITLFKLERTVAREILPRLAEAITADTESLVRLAAVEALRRCLTDAGPALPAIVAALGDANADVRRAAVLTLGDLGPAGQSHLAALTNVLGDTNPRVREAAALALQKIQPNLGTWQVLVW